MFGWIKGRILTPDQQAILDAINAIRKEAADEGLVDKYVPIKWSTDLEKGSLPELQNLCNHGPYSSFW